MSGGVDSCVTAALLAEQGYDIVGITMRVVPDEAYGDDSLFKPCCSAKMSLDARDVADRFGFPHYTVNLVENFDRQVVQDFTREYQSGRTPNPCVRCNQRLKYGTLYKKAVELEADAIATGHYVRLAERGGRLAIQRAVDLRKDQSYVMGGLSQKQLAMALFPLGDMTKEETRAKARELGLAAAETPESQDICFIPDNDYKGFLRRRVGPMRPGPIVNQQGEVLGEHQGLMDYTVGQRKGLGIGGGEPLYVLRLDIANNALIVGHADEAYCAGLTASEITWGGLAPQDDPFDAYVQIRYHHEPVACTVTPRDTTFEIVFHEPERSVTPGQWAVLYDEQGRVLAASVIDAYQTVAETSSQIDSVALSRRS